MNDQQRNHTDMKSPAVAGAPPSQNPLDQAHRLIDALGWEALLLTLSIAGHERKERLDAIAAGIMEAAAEVIGRHAKDRDADEDSA